MGGRGATGVRKIKIVIPSNVGESHFKNGHTEPKSRVHTPDRLGPGRPLGKTISPQAISQRHWRRAHSTPPSAGESQANGKALAWQTGELGASLRLPETLSVTLCQALPFASLLFSIQTTGRWEETCGSQYGQFFLPPKNGLDISRGTFGCQN